MIQSIVVGALLTFATVGIHVLGTAWWIDRLKKFSLASSSSGWRAVKILGATALLLLELASAEFGTENIFDTDSIHRHIQADRC
jgi:hypothetical protein